ncbi:hypothetical protein [Pantoea sp. USHLN298]|uniref:hypothetical protein n=1 Tax=Pantoea sp. USHLN298 TaxID=3081294 RepID=UPI0030189626
MQYLDDRKSLYQLIWSKPVNEAASELSITEQALIARCIELRIPRPMAGYWRAVARNNAPSIPPLPPLKANESISSFSQAGLSQHPSVVKDKPSRSSNNAKPDARRKTPSHSVTGAQLFFAAKEILLKAQITQLGYYKPTKRKLLDVNVSDTGLNDAEAFLLKFFATAERSGFRVRLAEMRESFYRRDISAFEEGGRDFLYPSLWKPTNESVISLDGISVGFSLVEMVEYVPAKRVKGRYVRDEKMISWSRGKNSAQLGYYSRHHIPCGRFRLQLYSPYEQEGWYQVFTQTKTCGLISQIPKIIKAAQSALPVLKNEIQAQKERAEAHRLRMEQQMIEYKKREAIRKREEAHKASVNELQGIMAKWAEDMRVEQFFRDAERDIEKCDAVLQDQLRERLRAARGFMQGETALQRLLKWRTPDERLK